MKKPTSLALMVISVLNATIWILLFVLDLIYCEALVLVIVLHGIAALWFIITAAGNGLRYQKDRIARCANKI